MRSATERPVALLLGPDRGAMSGISTHLNLLLASRLAGEVSLVHFQVGSEGRNETSVGRIARLLASPLQLAATILWRRAALVHVNTALNARAYWRDLAYIAVAKLCGARVLVQVHGGALPHEFFRHSRVLAALLRAALRLADTIVVLAQIELAAYRRFVPGKRVVAVPNAVDSAPYAAVSRPPSDARSPLQLAYVGRLEKAKGLYDLLQGLRVLHGRGTRHRLTIAGSGLEEGALRRFAADLGLARDVAFVGPVFGTDKVKLLRAADVFVLASHAEGLPYSLLEAMAAGVPVVTTRVGGIPDVVVEGVHGLFVAPRDPPAIAGAIAKLASDRDLLARMGTACQARIAEAYSLERLATEFCRLYSHLSAARRAQPPAAA